MLQEIRISYFFFSFTFELDIVFPEQLLEHRGHRTKVPQQHPLFISLQKSLKPELQPLLYQAMDGPVLVTWFSEV